jgi:hypothetical protein
MLTSMKWGTFVFFGVLTFIGSAFIWFYVPETKRLTLEEMDIIFGSSGVAVADQERMRAINKEIGLDRLVRGAAASDSSREKVDIVEANEKSVELKE